MNHTNYDTISNALAFINFQCHSYDIRFRDEHTKKRPKLGFHGKQCRREGKQNANVQWLREGKV